MTLKHDKQITISAAGSRRAILWPAQTLLWSEFIERCRNPIRGTETLKEYLRLPKSKQDDLKDVGGFVGGALKNNRRKANAVAGRDIITLDLDNIPPKGTQDVLNRISALGCGYCVYSTRKHEENAPRLRVLVPLDRTCSTDEYEPITRKLAEMVNLKWCDPSTFEASRLMYWPSCCKDSDYVFTYGDKPFLSVDGMLALYNDWRNVAEWPQVPGAQETHRHLADKQGDPREKQGVIGAFCRVYDIYKAMETFLPGVYEPCEGHENRYTYTKGSTTGGAVVYDDGLFLFSHHATDPCGGRLANAFDLVRLHKFSNLDDAAKPNTPINRMPSYMAMSELAIADEAVSTALNQSRYEQAVAEFQVAVSMGPEAQPAAQDFSWVNKFELNPMTGKPAKTLRNIQVVLEHDPLLKNRIYFDSFAESLIGEAPLPWGARQKSSGLFKWVDEDDAGLEVYLSQLLGACSTKMIETALRDFAAARKRNPVAEYLLSLKWDGTPRLDTLFIEYLGAEDCSFVRTVTRKAFVAAVARALSEEKVKFDYMLVVCGPQRIGKSTMLDKLGKDWFCDSIKTFEGKEAEEIIQGKWIIEIAELQALNKTDVNRVKQFLSKSDDQYRPAYGKRVKQQIRRCVFFGTTNDHEYLRDPTGNRRFWPVNARIQEPVKDVFTDLDIEVDQIWAEAVIRWRLGEPLFLSAEMEDEADRRREEHLERDPLQGMIEAFLERPIPQDWQKWGVDRRMMFWSGGIKDASNLVPRDRVCAAEIWRECFLEHKTLPKYEAHRINNVLRSLPGWEPAGIQRFGAYYGHQRGFRHSLNIAVDNVSKPSTKEEKVLTILAGCQQSPKTGCQQSQQAKTHLVDVTDKDKNAV